MAVNNKPVTALVWVVLPLLVVLAVLAFCRP
jgi:hypothetical protein